MHGYEEHKAKLSRDQWEDNGGSNKRSFLKDDNQLPSIDGIDMVERRKIYDPRVCNEQICSTRKKVTPKTINGFVRSQR